MISIVVVSYGFVVYTSVGATRIQTTLQKSYLKKDNTFTKAKFEMELLYV